MVKVSVVVPIYNVEKYLTRCIDSILGQSLKEIEVILATDGPKACDKICGRYARRDSRVKVLYRPGNYGAAVNRGLREAAGKYVGIAESDDICHPQMFRKLYDRAEETDADITKCGFYRADETGAAVEEILPGASNDVFTVKDFPYLLSFQPSVWSSLYKKTFLEKHNLQFMEGKISFVDSPFHMTTLLKAERIAVLNEPLYYYCSNAGQSVNSNKNIRDTLATEEFFFSNTDLNGIDSQDVKDQLIRASVLHFMWNYKRVASPRDKKTVWEGVSTFWKRFDPAVFDIELLSGSQKHFVRCVLSGMSSDEYEASVTVFGRRRRLINALAAKFKIIKNKALAAVNLQKTGTPRADAG